MSSLIEHERGVEIAVPFCSGNKSLVSKGELENRTKGRLTIMNDNDKKIWEGKVDKDFPKPFMPVKGSFSMASAYDGGSVEAAVLYSGKNKAGVDCAWLVGFLITHDDTRLVYVMCGNKANFNIDWDDIKSKIEEGGKKNVDNCQDEDTETYISATISSDRISGNYSVAAIYGVA